MPPKRKRPLDPMQAAQAILAEHMDRTDQPGASKNPAAVALGRLGGLKGGKARAAKLSKKARVASAKKAANARWGNG